MLLVESDLELPTEGQLLPWAYARFDQKYGHCHIS